MKNDQRTITSATITVTFELADLGTFGPGSSIAQAKQAAAARLTGLLGVNVDEAHVRVDSVSTATVNGSGKIEAIRR